MKWLGATLNYSACLLSQVLEKGPPTGRSRSFLCNVCKIIWIDTLIFVSIDGKFTFYFLVCSRCSLNVVIYISRFTDLSSITLESLIIFLQHCFSHYLFNTQTRHIIPKSSILVKWKCVPLFYLWFLTTWLSIILCTVTTIWFDFFLALTNMYKGDWLMFKSHRVISSSD